MILVPNTLFVESLMWVTAATSKNLEACIKEEIFREDLYYRLKVIHIHMPALREVPEDIPGLANHFLNKYCRTLQTDLNSSMN